jgi:hypothetical protein
MARKEDMNNISDTGEYGVFALNETSVGMRGSNNKRSDIQLVQFFLRQFYKSHPELFVMLPKTKSPSTLITIDGDCGGQTKTGILVFQRERRQFGAMIAVDGLVNVALSFVSSISRTGYTIHHLNRWFNVFADGNDYNGNLENHPEIIAFAPELQAELAAAKVGNEF